MRKLNVAVIGLGWVAEAHIASFSAAEGAQVTTVCSARNPSPAEVEARYGMPLKVYADYKDVLADPNVDVISLCTKNPEHPAQALAAIEAGKHLYIEKPIALNYEDAKRMRQAIQASKLKVCVGFELRYSKHYQLILSILNKGLLGDLHYGEADYYHGIADWYGQFRWSKKKDGGGSALLSAGCHAMDALLKLMGEPVEEVTSYSTKSRAACFAEYEFDPCSVTILKFANGKIGKVAACIDCLQPYYFHFHLVGSKGSLLDDKIYTTELPGLLKEKWTKLETVPIDSGEVMDHPYLPQCQEFINSIIHNTEMPLTGFEEGYESHRVIYAADLSAELGRPVKMSELN